MQPQLTLVPPGALNPEYKKPWRGVDMLHGTIHVIVIC